MSEFVSVGESVSDTLFVYEPESVRVGVGLALDCTETVFVNDLVRVPDLVRDTETVGVNGADVTTGVLELVYVLDTDAIEGVKAPELV